MTEGVSLSHLHKVPWDNINGAYVEVRQVTDHVAIPTTDPIGTTSQTEQLRKGHIVGRGEGTGVTWDAGEKDVRTLNIGPAIYIETPSDTVLEVRTDKSENELLEFDPADDE